MTPISNAIHMHPELTLHCLSTFQSSHITHRAKLISRVGDLQVISNKNLPSKVSLPADLENAASNFLQTTFRIQQNINSNMIQHNVPR